MKTSRRDFIKISSLGLGGIALSTTFFDKATASIMSSEVERTLQFSRTPTDCEVCFWKCAAHVYTEDERPWKIIGNMDDPHSGGRLCTRGTGGMATYTDPDRLKRPLLRTSATGKQGFKEVSWEEALDFIVDRMNQIAETHGSDRIAMFSHGSGGAHFKRL